MADKDAAQDSAGPDRISEIHMIAMAELQLKTGKLDYWAYYGELQDIKRRPLDATWLEASIAWGVIGRIRPARVTGFMRKLRDRREKQGQMAEFEGFRDRVNAYLAPARLTNHGFDRQTFVDLDHTTVWEQVSFHLSSLKEQGYDVFLNSGTLLGVVRDKQLIDHDDDIDLAIILKSETTEGAAEEWKNLKNLLQDIGLFDEKNFKREPIYKLTPVGGTQIDLFPAWKEGDKFFVYPHTHASLAVKDVLPLRMCEVTGNTLPANPEKMLEINYGEGWRHPDPLFKFPWASANKAFAPFLEALEQ